MRWSASECRKSGAVVSEAEEPSSCQVSSSGSIRRIGLAGSSTGFFFRPLAAALCARDVSQICFVDADSPSVEVDGIRLSAEGH